MTATLTGAGLRERLARLLDATVAGLDSQPGDRVQAEADIDTLNIAIAAVQDAPTSAEAARIFEHCLLSLAGVTSGGDAGTSGYEQGGE